MNIRINNEQKNKIIEKSKNAKIYYSLSYFLTNAQVLKSYEIGIKQYKKKMVQPISLMKEER